MGCKRRQVGAIGAACGMAWLSCLCALGALSLAAGEGADPAAEFLLEGTPKPATPPAPAAVPAPAPAPVAAPEPPAVVFRPAPALPPGLPAAAAVPAEEYKIRAGDVLLVWVFGQVDLTQAVKVSPTGQIDFPFVGNLVVVDKTTAQVAEMLTSSPELKKQLNKPMLSVSVREYAPITAFVLGAVVHPQQIQLPMDLPMTLTQAIAQVEGFREDAARENVRVYRRDKAGNTTTVVVNVAQILDENRPEADVVLKPGDTVYVSPRVTGGVFVLGAVAHPGFFDLKSFNRGGDDDTITVTQALAAAGGFTEDAVEEGVRLFRRSAGKDAGVSLQEVVNVTEVTDANAKSERKDPALKPGDTVFVPPRDKIFVVGRVMRAGAYSAPTGQKLTVTKAISLAGGFDPYAERSSVKIFRRDAPDARPEIVDVKQLFSSGDLRSDSVVNPGDLVFIPESIW